MTTCPRPFCVRKFVTALNGLWRNRNDPQEFSVQTTRATSEIKSTPQTKKWKRRLLFAASGLAVIGLCVVLRLAIGSSSAKAQFPNPFRKGETPVQQAAAQPTKDGAQQASAELPRAERPKHDVMAVVNGQDIRRDALATACCERFGNEVLEGLVNKRLIMHYCRNRNINVTDQEVDAEIDRMAKRFKIGKEQWLQMLENERGITRRTVQARYPLADARPAQVRGRRTHGERRAAHKSLRSPIWPGREVPADRRERPPDGRAASPSTSGSARATSPAWRCRTRSTSTARASAA